MTLVRKDLDTDGREVGVRVTHDGNRSESCRFWLFERLDVRYDTSNIHVGVGFQAVQDLDRRKACLTRNLRAMGSSVREAVESCEASLRQKGGLDLLLKAPQGAV